MAPIEEDTVENNLKDIIQDLYVIQSNTHGYLGPETQKALVEKIQILTTSLSNLSDSSHSIATMIPPDILSYIDDGRNPDIYTREFVEIVQKKNAHLRGKIEAFRGFAEVLEEEMKAAGIGIDGKADGDMAMKEEGKDEGRRG